MEQKEIKELQQTKVLTLLKTEYKFFYKQLLGECFEGLEKDLEGWAQDDLNDIATDNAEYESHLGCQSSVGLEEAIQITEELKESIETLKQLTPTD